ncbi:DNA-binding response regulator [Mucilaginibacter terrenus]|uniref:DNA-binding response regulator n=1 Tax=Mucilaginibacter terrenus TaxID=2482727 RepID=A0A3E2NW22_9SPHI|nr:LytTR family DNA-binding domain-containing protein [Mucilaginibacter terrenus]RFZ85111.1 DNA-binding response regulator [Mucilaginibacter terrenus]
MEYTCLILDDEPHALELLAGYVNKTPQLKLTATCMNPLAALEIIRQKQTDLCFADIDMPDLNGLDLADLAAGYTTMIFTTSFREYAVEAFEKRAADYLLKPITYPRFLACIEKVKNSSERVGPEDHFFIKTELKGKLLRLPVNGIRYIESAGNYVVINLKTEQVTAYLTLSELLEKLPAGRFSRIHKSFAVAHEAIRSMEHLQLRLDDGTVLPIGKAYTAAFMEHIAPFTFISKRT